MGVLSRAAVGVFCCFFVFLFDFFVTANIYSFHIAHFLNFAQCFGCLTLQTQESELMLSILSLPKLFKMSCWGTNATNQTIQDTTSKLREILILLSEPGRAAIATSSIATTYFVCKLFRNYRGGEKVFPNFEGGGTFQDQNPI